MDSAPVRGSYAFMGDILFVVSSEEDEEEEEEEEEFDEEAYLEAQRKALEEEQLMEALALLETLTQLPEKSDLKWTPHHKTLATSFLREAAEIILCCYLVRQKHCTKVLVSLVGGRIGGKARLAVSLNLPTSPVGVVWYFLKLDKEKHITASNFKRCVCYGTVDTDDPHEMNYFLLEVYQAVLLAVPATPPMFGHYSELAGLPCLINLVGGQMVQHVGAATDKPMLYLPPEVLALPDDPEQRRRLPLDTGLLARTEGCHHLLSVFSFIIHTLCLQEVQQQQEEISGQLVHLEGPLEQLYTDSVQALTEHMYDVLALLRIIWINSHYYHQQEVMTEVCVRVSWEVTRACQVHLPLDDLFSPITKGAGAKASGGNGKDSLSLVESAIKCCKEWRMCYVELATHFGEEDSPEVWLPDSASVFLPVELFVSRCEDLKYIGLSKVQLTRFREGMEEVERRYQCVMVAAVQTVDTVAHGLRVLNVFKPLAARKSLFSVFYVMIDHDLARISTFQILNLFDRDLEEVEKEYVFRSMKVGGEGFHYSKMARWAADTRRKLEQEVNLLKNQSWLPYYPRLDSIYQRWGRTVLLLRGVVSNMYAAWIASLEPNPSKRLLESIFRWRPGAIQSLQDNFDVQLYKDLEEAGAWKAMGFDIPDAITPIFADIAVYKDIRKKVMDCANGFNNFMSRVSRDEAQMFESQIQAAVKSFYPGLSAVTWMQRDAVATLLTRCTAVVRNVQEQVSQYLAVNQDLSSVLLKTKEMALYKRDDAMVYEGNGFQEDLGSQLHAAAEAVKSKFRQMEEILDSLHQKLISKTSVKAEQAWLAYVTRIDNLFLDCQREVLRRSLLSFEGMLMGSRSCPMEKLTPVFTIAISLTDGRIICKPSVSQVLQLVTSLETQFSESLGKIPCLLRRFSLEKAKAHSHLPALDDKLCSRLQAKLNSEFQTQVEELKQRLEEWQAYRDLWEVDRREFFEHYLTKANSVYIFETDIMTFERKLREIENTEDHMKVGTFYVNCETLKHQLIMLCKSWVSDFEKNLFKIASEKLDILYSYSGETRALLKSDPQDISSLLTAADECHAAKQQLAVYRREFQPVREQFDVLRKYHYDIPDKVNSSLEQLEKEWDAVEGLLTEKVLELNAALDGFRKTYNDRSELVLEEVDALKEHFRQALPTRLDRPVCEACSVIKMLKDMMADIITKLSVNETLMLLSLPTVEFPELPAFQHDLVSAEKMWSLLEEWQQAWESWANMIVWEVSVVGLQEMLSTFGHKLRAIKPFAAGEINTRAGVGEGDWELKEEFLTRIELCKLLVPLTLNLQNARLRTHHWDQIKALVKAEFDKDSPDFTLGFLQKLNLTSYKKDMSAILVNSTEEAKLVSEIDNIKSLASDIPLNLRAIPGMSVSVLESTSAANETIVELNTRLQVLSASHHARPYAEDIDGIRAMLSSMITFLEEVEALQRTWGTWEPFFLVPDVRLHMVYATSIFDSLNERWCQLSNIMTSEQFLKPVALHDHLRKEVRGMSSEFRCLTQQVRPYLQDRRDQYTRFWLLSDNDLVAALSTVIDGESARPFLPKLFTNITRIKQEKNSQLTTMEIIGVSSQEGEFLELNSYIPLMGSFDTWLKNLSSSIEATLKEHVRQCRNSMKSVAMKVDDVVKLWPLQVTVIAFLMHWTMEVSRTLAKTKGCLNGDTLQVFKKKIRDSQMRLDGCLQGSLPKLVREKVRLFYLTVLQMLLGVSQSPSWLLLESAHCLDEDVVPPLREMLKVVQEGQRAAAAAAAKAGGGRGSKLHLPPSVILEGIRLTVSPLAAVVLEMQPDQATARRTMDILKETCRPVVIFRPDVQVMTECLMVVEGFKESRSLSLKVSEAMESLASALPRRYRWQLGIRGANLLVNLAKDIIRRQPEVDEVDTMPLALREHLLPQLRENELPIFKEVFASLFPDFEAAPIIHEVLKEGLIEEMNNRTLIVKDMYTDKTLQLHEAISKNKIVIAFGPSGSGKSTSIELLHTTTGLLNEAGHTGFRLAWLEALSPLVVEHELLYGPQEDLAIGERSGHLMHLIQKCHKAPPTSDLWLLLEGPKDHKWLSQFFLHIHPTNSTFLCSLRQNISFPSNLKIILEVSGDIGHLSPGELAMCYTIHFPAQPQLWEDVIQSWRATIANVRVSRALQTLIKKNLPNFINILDAELVSKPQMIMKAKAFVAIMNSLMEAQTMTVEPEDWVARLTPAFIFSIIWSFGANISQREAAEFEEVVTRMIEDVPEGGIYDYFVDPVSGSFLSWSHLSPEIEQLDIRLPVVESSLVPTQRIIKYTRIIRTLMDQGIPVLLTGPPGSGKTTIINVLRQIPNKEQMAILLSFTANTHPVNIQSTLESQLMKQGKNTLACKKSKLHVLIDDLHCSEGSDHLHEILATVRYTTQRGKLFSHDSKAFLTLPPLCYLFTMQRKTCFFGQEKTQEINEHIDGRWLETFHSLTLPEFYDKELEGIFSKLFDEALGHFDQEVKCLRTVLAEGVVYLFRCMGKKSQVACGDYLSLVHHPRQIFSVLKGLQLGDEETQDRDNFLRHLTHECYRVFHDLGVMPQEAFDQLMNEVLTEYLCIGLNTVTHDPSNFMLTRLGNEEDLYDDANIQSLQQILEKSGQALLGPKQTFVVFNSLIHHLVRLLRILGYQHKEDKEPSLALGSVGGHVVLVGPEGCGKKTCARLVSSLAGYKTHDVTGTPEEEVIMTRQIIADLLSGTPVLVIIDWNILQNVKNLKFLNDLLVQQYYWQSPRDSPADFKILLSVPSLEEAHEVLRSLPAMSSYYSIDSFQEWSTEDLQLISRRILSSEIGERLSDIILQSITEVMAFIHASSSPAPSSKFLEFLKMFLQVFCRLYDDIINEKEKLSTSIVKFEDTQKRVKELSNQLEEQRAQVTYIQQSCGSVVLKMRNIRSEQGRLEQDLAKNDALLQRQKDESSRIRELISRDLTAPKLEMKAVHRRLDRVTRAEMEGLRGLSRPPRSVELVFDAVLTTLELDPSWNEAKKQMANALDFVSGIKKKPVEEVHEKILSIIQSYLKMEELTPEKVTGESETAATFLTWLQVFEKYVRVYKDYHPLKVQADIIAKEIDATEQSIKQYKNDLAGFSIEHQTLMTQLKEKEQHLEAAEEEMKVLEGRIQLAQKVMTQLGQDKIHWEESLSHSSVQLRNIFGDAVLAAAYVTYLGDATHTARGEVMARWQEKMEELCLFHTAERNVLDVLAPLHARVRWHEQGLPLDAFSLENAAIICYSSLPQLILDPHHVLEQWIRNWSDTTEVDLEKSDYLQKLEDLLQSGSTCLIVQEELALPTSVLQVLEMERHVRDGKNVLLVGDTELQVHDNFRMLILLTSREPEITSNMRSLANVVSMQSQQEGLEVLLTSRVASHYQPDLVESLKKNEWDLLDREKQLAEQEETIRTLMSRFDDDVLEENTLMEQLQTACSRASDAKRKCNDLRKSLDAAKEGNATYRKIAGLLTRLYLIVERFPRLQPSLELGLEHLSTLIIGEMHLQSLVTSWGRLLGQNIVIKMLQSVYRHLEEQVSPISLVTVGLILASWYECHIGLTTPQFCSLLYTQLVDQDESRPLPLDLKPYLATESQSTSLLQPFDPGQHAALRPVWLTERQWLQIISLSKIEPFQELADHMVTHENLWRVWYITEQPETGTLPKKMDRKIRGVAKLILINCLRPDRLDEASMMYVQRVLKHEASEATAKALLSVAGKGNAASPIILYSSVPLDVEFVLHQIQALCHPIISSDPEALDVLALGQGREDSLTLRLQRCLLKGHWLLLKKGTAASACIARLTKFLRNESLTAAHKRFQIWMYFDNDDELPSSLMTACRKVYLSLPCTVKESLRHLYELVGESRLAAYTNEWSKWCLLSLALFHIAFITRQTLENNSTPLAVTLGDTQWEEAENTLRTLLTGGHPADSSLIASLIPPLTDLYLAGCLTEESRSILTQLMSTYLSPEAIQNVPGRVSALTHYTVPRATFLEEHLAQMEFIYLAQNVSLTGVAPMVILQNQRDEARDINIALRTLNEQKTSQRSLQDTVWPRRFVELRDRKLKGKKIKGALQAIMRQEYEDCSKVVHHVASKLAVTEDLNTINSLLQDSSPSLEITKDDTELRKTEARLKKLNARADFLWEMAGSCEPPRNLRLGLLQEPEAAWAAVTRSFWGELRQAALEVAVLTRALSACLATKGGEEDVKGVGDEEESPSLVLEKLVLRGACWDAAAEVLMTEELGAGLPAATTLDLTVTKCTARVKKVLRKTGRVHRTPVHVGGADTCTPLFWVHLPLASSITSHTCLLSGVRLITA
ncbi:Dynein heavy chain 2, axonemal [Portunus trituberculatus]|uniref:Dynein heavy chain 2, axonemal n=1 Tax=Portunus trituberculatus TaxID=210409 RepID=A0A5B7CR15_PORTR|nr:Dynein heavy chain 2, axonemal [Portunus trituberculatus]